jgi:glycosyltransferase involved in cell wall biosynthesis
VKLLFAQKLPYLPVLNGASRVGRCLLEGLAERGHECRAIALVGAPAEELKLRESRNRNDRSSLTILELSPSHQVFMSNGVKVYAFANGARLHERLKEQIQEFDPTWTIISEDPTYMLLAQAAAIDRRHTIYFSQSQATLPFGPEAFVVDRFKKQMLEEVAGILTVSTYLKSYIQRWGGLDSFVASIPVYGVPPFPHLSSIDNPHVTMVNPSKIKGLPIFLELARRFRGVKFAAVPTWATSAADRTALGSLPNVEILPPSADVDDLFRRSRVLLVPSLWGEAFGLVVVEAMLRGIPVLASDVGGLREAKLGVDFLLPVRRIERYESRRDENGMPIPVVPDQNVDAWDGALRKVLSDKGEFNRISVESRKAAMDYVLGLSIVPTEQYLEELAQRRSPATVATNNLKTDLSKFLAGLPAEKLEVLAAQLRKHSQ